MHPRSHTCCFARTAQEGRAAGRSSRSRAGARRLQLGVSKKIHPRALLPSAPQPSCYASAARCDVTQGTMRLRRGHSNKQAAGRTDTQVPRGSLGLFLWQMSGLVWPGSRQQSSLVSQPYILAEMHCKETGRVESIESKR